MVMARRCLQAMVRDRYGVSDNKLNNEIQAIKRKVGEQLHQALDALRIMGNIGAHPPRDADKVEEFTPTQAAQLLELIEKTIDDWYVNRKAKDTLEHGIIEMAKSVIAARKG